VIYRGEVSSRGFPPQLDPLSAIFAGRVPLSTTDGTDAPRSTLEIRQVRHLAALPFKETIMSQEKPNGDPRQRTDWKSSKQTDEPWKGPVEKEQKPTEAKPDLEKWHDTNTH
jgi:hypothetical protein